MMRKDELIIMDHNTFHGLDGKTIALEFNTDLINLNEITTNELTYVKTEYSAAFNGGYRFMFSDNFGTDYYFFPDEILGFEVVPETDVETRRRSLEDLMAESDAVERERCVALVTKFKAIADSVGNRGFVWNNNCGLDLSSDDLRLAAAIIQYGRGI